MIINFNLVVAHYNENLDWLKETKIDKAIFHKGSNSPYGTKLPNIGREAHTYLYYIVENYNNLKDYTIFCQGNPFDHFKDMLSFLNNLPLLENIKKYQDIFALTHDSIATDDRSGRPHCYPPVELGKESDRLFSNIFKEFPFTPGAQFVVPRQNLLNRSKEFYEKCLTADWTYLHMPVVYERLWLKIFDKEIYDRNRNFIQ